MHEIITSFISNDSAFGKAMTRLGIIIGANLMFVLFSLPVFTVGAGAVALYHVMLKALRGDGVINPFKQFWLGFKGNFKQGTIIWLITLLLVLFGYVDVRICLQAGGMVALFRYPIYLMGGLLLVLFLYLLPVMAAFEDTIPHLMRNAVYFALKKPLKLIVILFFNVFPMVLTYTDSQYQPLYAFLWFMFGYGAIAMLGASLLLPEFIPHLPIVDDSGDFILDADGQKIAYGTEISGEEYGGGDMDEDEKKMMEDMMKMDGLM